MSTSDPISRVGLFIAVVLIAAKVAGDVATRLKQPSVLGELVIGILLGSLPLESVRAIRTDPGVDLLARLGVLVLLFEVGLESTVRDVMRVGASSALVAVFGTAGTLLCAWPAARLAMPGAGALAQLFLAASLTATSIGISARVLKDAGASRGKEALTILGASVIDDILGLVALALVHGAIVHAGSGGGSAASVAWMIAKTLAFLAVALWLGVKVSPWIFRMVSRLRSAGALLAAGLSLCFLLSWASDIAGLAPIVGAFAAGLILEDSHSAWFVGRGERSLGEAIEPISSWLVPIFFVLIGMRADLRALGDPGTLALVACLFAAAVLGKLTCALAVPRGADRLAVAFGMLPRGEVSLVFANLGLTLTLGGRPLLDRRAYAALVTVVILTTIATPPALRWRVRRRAAA
ncbi:MAG: cation:proton antiporter [Myxococcales bacterium]|nr:cation:proton antiporter [Myxococcales bacterium]